MTADGSPIPGPEGWALGVGGLRNGSPGSSPECGPQHLRIGHSCCWSQETRSSNDTRALSLSASCPYARTKKIPAGHGYPGPTDMMAGRARGPNPWSAVWTFQHRCAMLALWPGASSGWALRCTWQGTGSLGPGAIVPTVQTASSAAAPTAGLWQPGPSTSAATWDRPWGERGR